MSTDAPSLPDAGTLRGHSAEEEEARAAQFFRDVGTERARQLATWGDQRHEDGTNLGNAGWRAFARDVCQRAAAEDRVTWAHILHEEFAEALAEVDPAGLRAELVQVAAVCAAWVSDLDRRAAATGQPEPEPATGAPSPTAPAAAPNRTSP